MLADDRGWTGLSSIVAPVCELDPDEERREAGQGSVKCTFHLPR